jgi:hypothetical protein
MAYKEAPLHCCVALNTTTVVSVIVPWSPFRDDQSPSTYTVHKYSGSAPRFWVRCHLGKHSSSLLDEALQFSVWMSIMPPRLSLSFALSLILPGNLQKTAHQE